MDNTEMTAETNTEIPKQWFSVYPGTMGLCGLAIKLFGVDNVSPGSWLTPVYVQCTEDDVKTFVELADSESKFEMKHGYRIRENYE